MQTIGLANHRFVTRATIYRSLGALRARNPKKVSKRVFLGVFKKDPENTRKSRKTPQKEEVFGTDVPRTSGGHSRGYPGPELRSGRSDFWKKTSVSARTSMIDPKARTSTTLSDFQKLRSEKIGLKFRSLNHRLRNA